MHSILKANLTEESKEVYKIQVEKAEVLKNERLYDIDFVNMGLLQLFLAYIKTKKQYGPLLLEVYIIIISYVEI